MASRFPREANDTELRETPHSIYFAGVKQLAVEGRTLFEQGGFKRPNAWEKLCETRAVLIGDVLILPTCRPETRSMVVPLANGLAPR